MAPTFIADAVRVVNKTYGAEQARIATEGNKTLARIVELRLSCPRSTVKHPRFREPTRGMR